MNKRVNKMIKISFLLAVAVVLNYFESLLPLPLPVPGVRLGLANCIGLIALYLYDEKEYILFNILKVILVGLLRSGFGSSFFISFSGMILSTVIVLVVYKLTKASIYGLSVAGAVFHSVGQVLMVAILYSNIYMINYLAILISFSVVSGLITAFIASVTLQKLPNSVARRTV